MTKLVPAPKYSPEDRENARRLFLQGKALQKISAETGVGMPTLSKWASTGQNGISWHTEREELIRGQLEDGFTTRKLTVSKAADIAPELLLKGLEYLQARDTPLSVQEMERVMTVHSGLDRITRLDSGKSTENSSVNVKVKLSMDEIRDILKADPLSAEGE
jgi:transposase-like protein